MEFKRCIRNPPYRPNQTTSFLKNYLETLGTSTADKTLTRRRYARKSPDTPGYLPLKYARPM